MNAGALYSLDSTGAVLHDKTGSLPTRSHSKSLASSKQWLPMISNHQSEKSTKHG